MQQIANKLYHLNLVFNNNKHAGLIHIPLCANRPWSVNKYNLYCAQQFTTNPRYTYNYFSVNFME